jgi:hypothetical protein
MSSRRSRIRRLARVGCVGRHRPRPAISKVVRSDQGLVELLHQQFELLKGACLRYDGGDALEVINIAIRLRVILHDSKSLIRQLRLGRDLRFLDTSTHRLDPERNPCIANIRFDVMPDGARWRPLLDRWPDGHPKPSPQRFKTWWIEPIMPTSTPQGLDHTPRYSREDLVLYVAHQDGGAHVDHRDAAYDQLTREYFTFEIAVRSPDGPSPYKPVEGNPVNACIRQIAHEVLFTLSHSLPGVLEARSAGTMTAGDKRRPSIN